MGWTFCDAWQTKKQIVDSVLSDCIAPGCLVDSKSVTSGLWVLFYSQHAERKMIAFFKIERQGGSYGYKDMTEDMGPYFYDCPVRFLANADEPVNDTAREFRESVKTYWLNKHA